MSDRMTVSLDGIPVLETARLILRAPRAEDAAGYIAVHASERARYMGGNQGHSAAWTAFATEIGHWVVHGFGMWAVTRRGDDRRIGMVGGWFPAGWPEKEIGWTLWPEAEGQGIAHEAALAARAHAYRVWGWKTAVSYVDPANVRSRRLAERLGAVLDADADRVDPEDVVYRHPSPEDL